MVDRLSSYIRCQETMDETTTSTTRAMETWFELLGYPERIRAGYGPSFRAGFNEWLEGKGITREWPSSNNSPDTSLAERAARRYKCIIKRCMDEGADWREALEEMGNLPSRILRGASPAQVFHQGRIRRPAMPQGSPTTGCPSCPRKPVDTGRTQELVGWIHALGEGRLGDVYSHTTYTYIPSTTTKGI